MFIRRQDLIDQFASNFRETGDGQLVYQPGKTRVGLPVSWEDYEAVTVAFERVQMVNMAITWAVFAGAMGVGYYYLITQGRYVPFFIAFGVACLFTFMLHLRDGLALLLPFAEARKDLEKRMIEAGQLPPR